MRRRQAQVIQRDKADIKKQADQYGQSKQVEIQALHARLYRFNENLPEIPTIPDSSQVDKKTFDKTKQRFDNYIEMLKKQTDALERREADAQREIDRKAKYNRDCKT